MSNTDTRMSVGLVRRELGPPLCPDFYQLVRTVGPVDEREGVVHVGQRRVFGREDVLACADLDAPVLATVRT